MKYPLLRTVVVHKDIVILHYLVEKILREKIEKKRCLFRYFCQYACPHHQSNRLVACSTNFISLGGHALRGKFNSQYYSFTMRNLQCVIALV